jgi:integrase
VGPDDDFTNRNTTFMTWNLMHLARMLAVLVFAGLRLGELLSLRWRDVDLAGGWLPMGGPWSTPWST